MNPPFGSLLQRTIVFCGSCSSSTVSDSLVFVFVFVLLKNRRNLTMSSKRTDKDTTTPTLAPSSSRRWIAKWASRFALPKKSPLTKKKLD